MKKLLTFILGSIFALNLSISVANSAAKEVMAKSKSRGHDEKKLLKGFRCSS